MALEPKELDQLRESWLKEATKRGFFSQDDLISRKALHDSIGEQELFAHLSKKELRECGCHFDEKGEFYFTDEQWPILAALVIAMRKHINAAPAADIVPTDHDMQEILFHGKRKDNGKWIEGDVFHRADGRVFIGEITTIDCSNDGAGDKGEPEFTFVEVEPETVAPYIGLTDIHGKKIFVGDVVRQLSDDRDPNYADKGTVYWNQSACMYARTSHYDESYNVPMRKAYRYEFVCSSFDIVLD